MMSIFIRPLSIGPAKPVCGFTRLQTTHVIGLEGQAIEMDRKTRDCGAGVSPAWAVGTAAKTADDDRLDAGADRAADERLGDAVAFEHLPLPFGRAAAVAAHGGHDERFCPEALQMFDNRPGDRGDIGDAAAAGGNGHALARPDFLAQVEPRKLGMDLARHVFDAGGVESLAEAEYFRKSGHICSTV